MWKKIASLAAMLAASLTVSGCETSAGKPIIYKPIPTGRTARIPQTVKAANKATTTVKKPAKAAEKAKPKSSPQPVVNLPKRDDGYTFPRGN